MIAIIDYESGNLCSVENALHRLGAEWTLTADPDVIRRSDRVLLPGVGHAGEAVGKLRSRGLEDVIRSLRQPVLGICVGMQVLCLHTEEGDVDGLRLFDTHVRRFVPSEPSDKVPEVGWNSINNLESKLLKDVVSGAYVYYVHSYYAELCCDTIATTRFGTSNLFEVDDECQKVRLPVRHGGLMYSAALKYENFYGTQFHPEKSGDVGETILRNFLKL